jgi:hypothetical protein
MVKGEATTVRNSLLGVAALARFAQDDGLAHRADLAEASDQQIVSVSGVIYLGGGRYPG